METQTKVSDANASPKNMRAMVIKRFGSADVFEMAHVPVPLPKGGEVVIRAQATSLNPIDLLVRSGTASAIAPAFPAVLHGDLAGVVELVGDGVSRFQIGDKVYGCVGGVGSDSGVLSELVLADASLLSRRPVRLTASQAATLPLVSITAWEALVDRAQLSKGQTILIHGGLGGVGHIAIQIAKARGAVVHTTVSTREKGLLALELGADVVINYRQETVSEYVKKHTDGFGYDIVFDTVGGSNLENSFAAAKVGGTVATIQAMQKIDLTNAHLKGLTLHVVFMLLPLLTKKGRSRHGEILDEITQLVDRGQLKPVVDNRIFQMFQISEAHKYFETSERIGKVAVVIDGELNQVMTDQIFKK